MIKVSGDDPHKCVCCDPDVSNNCYSESSRILEPRCCFLCGLENSLKSD